MQNLKSQNDISKITCYFCSAGKKFPEQINDLSRRICLPSEVAILQKLVAGAMCGPQVAATANGLLVTAGTNNGNDSRRMVKSLKSKMKCS
jgi:hypothetical protein